MKTLLVRFKDKIAPTKCWEWRGALVRGYGQLKASDKLDYAHRISYELFIGKISSGLVIDHLCRNPKCVNPLHLEPVTHKVNILRGVGASAMNARKTACHNGHPFTRANTYYIPPKRLGRMCRTCNRASGRKYYLANIRKIS